MFDVSVIIVSWNTSALLTQCLETTRAWAGPLALEIIVVDNASTDDSVSLVRKRFPEVKLLVNTENVGFARANNVGVAAATGRYALLLNSDAFLTEGALPALVALADLHPRVGLIGAHLRNADGTFQASHTAFPTLWRELLLLSGLGRALFGAHFPSHGPEEELGAQQVDYVEGACLLVRLEAYRAVGGLDEGYFMYSEEVDLCYTLRGAGWEVWYEPSARVTHLGGGSSQNRRPQREGDLYRSRIRFFSKHYGTAQTIILKLLILGFTVVKRVTHGVLRLISGGRIGRPVVSLRDLMRLLKQ